MSGLFVSDGKVAGWYEQSISVDLHPLVNKIGYERRHAMFRVVRENGGVQLEKM